MLRLHLFPRDSGKDAVLGPPKLPSGFALGQFWRPSDGIFSRVPRKKVEFWPIITLSTSLLCPIPLYPILLYQFPVSDVIPGSIKPYSVIPRSVMTSSPSPILHTPNWSNYYLTKQVYEYTGSNGCDILDNGLEPGCKFHGCKVNIFPYGTKITPRYHFYCTKSHFPKINISYLV